MHFVEIKPSGTGCPVARTLTTTTSWTLDAASWAALKATNGATLQLVITSAYVQQNRIQEGPFRAATPLTFKVQ